MSIFPVPSSRAWLPYRSIQRRQTPVGSHVPEWEAEMLDLARVFAYLASCRWFRRVRANGRLDLGGYDY
jgi:hypothetical protein